MISIENVLKTSCQDVKIFWSGLQLSWRRLKDVLKTFLQDVLKTSWKRLEDVSKTSWRRMTKMNILVLIKTSSEDVWLIYSSWSRRLQDVFIKTNVYCVVNPDGNKTLLANSLSTFFIKGKPVFSNGPKSLIKILSDFPILCN